MYDSMTLFLQKNRVLLITSISVFVLFLFFGMTQFVHAQARVATAEPDSTLNILSRLGNLIGNFILFIGSFFTWFGGMLLDASIRWFILDIAVLIGDGTALGATIANLWILIRDICNLAFIFGFIYVGIRTIIDADSSTTKRMLASIIIGAILINFSLFFAKVIIDVSNYISTEIHTQMISGSGVGSISSRFNHALGISTTFSFPNAQEFANRSNGGNIAYYFMATVMLMVAGFIFAAGAVLLMIRFVALVFILIFSPVLFAATVFPATQEQASKLWKQLISYSFFAPVYLLLLVISIRVLDGVMLTMRLDSTNMAQALSNGYTGQNAFGIILNFGITIFFLIMSLQIAQKFGVAGAERTMAIGKSLQQKVRGGITGFAGRNTLGWAGSKLGKGYDKLDARADKATGVRRFALKAIRNTAVVAAGGERNLRGGLEATKKAKYGGSYSYSDDETYNAEQKKRRATETKLDEFKANAALGTAELLTKKPDKLTEEDKKAKTKLERAIADASTKQLEELEQEQRVALVEFMTQSQIDALGKSDELSEAEKDEINKARSDQFIKKYGDRAEGETAQKLRNNLSKANSDQLSAMGTDFLMEENHAVRLTGSQMDDLKKKLTPTEYSRVDDARKAALKKLAEDGGTIDGKTAQNHILKMKASDMSKLPREVLIALAPSLPTATLIEIAKQNTLNTEDQRSIREGIINTIDEYTSGNHYDNISPEDQQQLEAAQEFLDKNPYGKSFGR